MAVSNNRAQRRKSGHGGAVNPRNIPKTQKDVDDARSLGRDEGMTFLLNVITYVCMDRHEASDEDLQTLARDVDDICDSIARGYLSYPDLVRDLRDTHGCAVELRQCPLKVKK